MFDWKSTRPLWPHFVIVSVLLAGIVLATGVLARDVTWSRIDAPIGAPTPS